MGPLGDDDAIASTKHLRRGPTERKGPLSFSAVDPGSGVPRSPGGRRKD